MTTATVNKQLRAPITKSASDGSGTFEAVVYAFERDKDGERFQNFVNLPARVPLHYQHVGSNPGTGREPGAKIGTAMVSYDQRLRALRVHGTLNLKNPMGAAVYERMMMGRDEELALNEFSVGFSFPEGKTYRDADGTRVLVDAELAELSVVYQGAQRTELVAIKSAKAAPAIRAAVVTDNGLRTRCVSCGRYSAIPTHPQTVFGEHVYVGVCACGTMYSFSPKSWSDEKGKAAFREVRGRVVMKILAALRGAPPQVIKSAMSSARLCLDDPDGYTIKEFVERVKDIVDGAVDDDAAGNDTPRVQKSVADRNLVAALDSLEAEVNVSEKGEKHRLLSTMNPAGVIIHLRDTVECRVDGDVITGTVVAIREQGIVVAVGEERYVVQLNDVLSANSDLSRAVDELIVDVRREKAAEDAEAKRIEEQANYLRAITPPEEREAREQERARIADEERERLAAERDAERAAGERSDEIRRRANWRQVGGADIKWGDN